MDGRDDERGENHRGRELPAIAVGIVGIAIGVLGALALTGDGNAPGSPEPRAELPAAGAGRTADTSTTTTTVPIPEEPRLTDLALGLLDTLVASGLDGSGNPTVEAWPAMGRQPRAVPLPAGALESDVTNRWISIVSDQRYGEGRILWVGNERYVEPVSADVLDAVWNASISGQLAWLEQASESEFVIRTRTFLGESESDLGRDVTIADVTRLLWYTREGITVEVADPEPRLVTIRPDGTRVEAEPGIEFLAGTDLFALVRIDGDPFLIDSSLQAIAEFPDQITGCRTALFSPLTSRSHRRVGLSCQIQNTTLLAAFEIEMISSARTSAEAADGPVPGEITNLGGQPILGLTSVSWAGGDRFITTVLPVNGPIPESIVTIWDVEAHETELFQWPAAMFAIESISP